MNTYAVVVKATVIKTIEVRADSSDEAEETAHGEFSVLCDSNDECYDQETLSSEILED